MENPTRRSVLAGAASAATVLSTSLARAADEPAFATRPIPHGSGERLPVVGVGTSKVFEVGDDDAKRRELAQVLRTLVVGGGSVVDTASSYGTAEEVIGAISGDLRAKLFLATKLEAREGTEAEAEFARSLKRLRVDKVDLLQAHNIEEGDAGLPFFFELKKRGLTRYVGCTTTFSDEYAAMEAIIRRDKPDFVEVDCSIANRETEEAADPGSGGGRRGGADRPALRALLTLRQGERQAATPVARGDRRHDLGPSVPEVPGWQPDDHLRHPRHRQGEPHGGQPRRRPRPMPDAKQRAALVSYFERL